MILYVHREGVLRAISFIKEKELQKRLTEYKKYDNMSLQTEEEVQ